MMHLPDSHLSVRLVTVSVIGDLGALTLPLHRCHDLYSTSKGGVRGGGAGRLPV